MNRNHYYQFAIKYAHRQLKTIPSTISKFPQKTSSLAQQTYQKTHSSNRSTNAINRPIITFLVHPLSISHSYLRNPRRSSMHGRFLIQYPRGATRGVERKKGSGEETRLYNSSGQFPFVMVFHCRAWYLAESTSTTTPFTCTRFASWLFFPSQSSSCRLSRCQRVRRYDTPTRNPESIEEVQVYMTA